MNTSNLLSNLPSFRTVIYLHTVREWPRLHSSQERPHWLRVDFDHWEELSDGEEGEEDGEGGEKALARERVAEIKEKQVKLPL